MKGAAILLGLNTLAPMKEDGGLSSSHCLASSFRELGLSTVVQHLEDQSRRTKSASTTVQFHLCLLCQHLYHGAPPTRHTAH
jgi:hypothetical protein